MSTKQSKRKSKGKHRKEEKWVEVTLSPEEEPKRPRIRIDRKFPDHDDVTSSSAKRHKVSTSHSPHKRSHHLGDKEQIIGPVPVPSTSASPTGIRKRKHEDSLCYSDKRAKHGPGMFPSYYGRTSGEMSRIQFPDPAENFKTNVKKEFQQFSRRGQRRWKVPPPKDFIGFAGKDNELSNFYPCRLYVYGMLFGSTEHAYQWSKAMCMGNRKVANKIHEAEHAGKAKRTANQYFRGADLSAWIPWRIPVMKKLLRAKARCCKPFRDTLRHSGNRLIAEVVPRECYWGIGDGTGENMMGKLLMELRHNLDDALNADPDEDGKMIDFSKPPL